MYLFKYINTHTCFCLLSAVPRQGTCPHRQEYSFSTRKTPSIERYFLYKYESIFTDNKGYTKNSLLVLEIRDQYCFPKTRYFSLFPWVHSLFCRDDVHTVCRASVTNVLMPFWFNKSLEVELPRDSPHWLCRVIHRDWRSRHPPSPLHLLCSHSAPTLCPLKYYTLRQMSRLDCRVYHTGPDLWLTKNLQHSQTLRSHPLVRSLRNQSENHRLTIKKPSFGGRSVSC